MRFECALRSMGALFCCMEIFVDKKDPRGPEIDNPTQGHRLHMRLDGYPMFMGQILVVWMGRTLAVSKLTIHHWDKFILMPENLDLLYVALPSCRHIIDDIGLVS